MSLNLQRPVAVLGLPLNSLRVLEAVEAIEKLILSGGTHQVAAANLDFWLNAIADQHLHRIIAGCSLVVPDGMPLVWASGLMGCPLAERVTGVDLLPLMAAMSAKKGYTLFMVGSKKDVMHRAAERLQRDFVGVKIVGICASEQDNLTKINHNEILERIHAAKPDILLVAFDNAKQEKWIWMHRKRLGVPVSIGVGEALETLAGDLPRGPLWVRQCGFEWLIRCLRDPGRLAPRYLRDLLGLSRKLPLALAAAWFQRPYFRRSSVEVKDSPEARHIALKGNLADILGFEMEQEIRSAIAAGKVAVVHLQDVHHMSAAGLGLLLDARRQMLEAGLTLSLAGLNWKMRLLFHAWCVRPLFDEWQPVLAKSRSLSLIDDPPADDQESGMIGKQLRIHG